MKGEPTVYFLSASQTQQPDYVALAMVLVLALIVVIMVIRKKQAAKLLGG